MSPRAASQPWVHEAIGNAEWTGTPLAPILQEAGLSPSVREIVFTGLDRGIQGGVEHAYERSLALDEALRDDVLLVYAMNGEPLLPQHGFPLRLIVPGWYGMTHVKWLHSITAAAAPFRGWQQEVAYTLRSTEEETGRPVTRMQPRSLVVPPGIPEFLSRARFLASGPCTLTGRAWSGWAPVDRVEVSDDVGATWADAILDPPAGEYAWRGWSYEWDATAGEHELCCRATDAAANVQPLEPDWNLDGYCNNAVQRVHVTVA
jgi:DMSO/TMAO reductase YedYZ molybdopterin-dependent catalytic subunit